VPSARRHLHPAEVEALLAAASLACPSGLRNRLLVELLYRGGLELSEALALRDPDVEVASHALVRLRVDGQRGRTTRSVELRSELIASCLIPQWRSLRPPGAQPFLCTLADTASACGFGGPARAGQPLRDSYVRTLVTRLGGRAGLASGLASPRALRHSHIVHTLSEGDELRHVQRRVGHSRLNTTAQYLHFIETKAS